MQRGAQAGLPEDAPCGSPSFGLAVPSTAGSLPARTVRSFDEGSSALRGRGERGGPGCGLAQQALFKGKG